MYALHIPSDIAKLTVNSNWNLGEIYLTEGVMNAVTDGIFSVETFLGRHFAGDYGLINNDPVDMHRTINARLEGRIFTSIFSHGEDFVKVVSHPSPKRTVICFSHED